jgi:hypothetical protein
MRAFAASEDHMIIRMYSQMSSGRHDGRTWPAPGVEFEVPDWEGRDLVDGGNAVMVSDKPTADYVPPPDVTPSAEPQPWPPYEPGRLAGPVPAAPDPEPDGVVEGTSSLEPPKAVQPKGDWVAWAVAQGAVSEEEASGLTKQQLMEAYGQRA